MVDVLVVCAMSDLETVKTTLTPKLNSCAEELNGKYRNKPQLKVSLMSVNETRDEAVSEKVNKDGIGKANVVFYYVSREFEREAWPVLKEEFVSRHRKNKDRKNCEVKAVADLKDESEMKEVPVEMSELWTIDLACTNQEGLEHNLRKVLLMELDKFKDA